MKTQFKSFFHVTSLLCICLICASCSSKPSLNEQLNSSAQQTTTDTTETSQEIPSSESPSEEKAPSTEDTVTTETSVTTDVTETVELDATTTDSQKVADNTSTTGEESTTSDTTASGTNESAVFNGESPSIDSYNFDRSLVYEIQDIDSLYVLVNKWNELPSTYKPANLVKPNIPFSTDTEDEKHTVRSEMGAALELLFAAAKEDGVSLVGVSGYRSYARQKTIYSNKVAAVGKEAADKVSAQPGRSEHQTGLAIDVSCKAVDYNLTESFGETPEGLWLDEHAHEYGFIIRYQHGKTDITGYNYEPWHIRYVGEEIAGQIYTSEETLDQFYENLESQN